ncbi:DMT family transporter [Aureimonas frigidaquae]|uniref:DMT family transporter n=1 Tax=Aureimonas frigidaquae TaxID=424757 RepID=UPI0009F8FE6E|nr:DMT family transporter [Aureimonas frigidaquae]
MPHTDSPAPLAPHGRAAFGIVLMLVGVFMFASNDALGKFLIATYSIGQILLIRSFAALAILSPFIWRERRSVLKPARRHIHIMRAVCSTAEVALFYGALFYLPLADVMTFYLAGPIYVTALSALILKEQVGWRRWSAVLVGFLGVLIALGPTFNQASLGAIIAVAGSFTYALLMISTRFLSHESGTTLITWQTVAALIFGLVTAPFDWTPVDLPGFAALALLGVIAMLAHVCVNQSLRVAEASVVVPYQYTLIVWAIVYGVLFFGDEPRLSLLAGAALIVGSGLFIFLREQRKGRATASIAPELATVIEEPQRHETAPDRPQS